MPRAPTTGFAEPDRVDHLPLLSGDLLTSPVCRCCVLRYAATLTGPRKSSPRVIIAQIARVRLREIIRQTCEELGVQIVKGVLSTDHVHMFVSIPPHLALSTVMQRIKGRSSRRIQIEYPELRKRYWGRRFWARGYFSTTSGNVTDDVILQYLELHSQREPTGVRR